MRYLLTILSVILFFGVSFAMDATEKKDNEEIIYTTPDGVTISYISSSSDKEIEKVEALHCKTRCANGDVHSCWFCDCSELPECGEVRMKRVDERSILE